MNNIPKYVKNLWIVGITKFIIGFQSIIMLPILTNNMSISNYGVFNQIIVTIGLIPQIVLFGLPFTLVRYLPIINEKEKKEDIYLSLFCIIIIFGLITSIFMNFFSTELADILFGGQKLVVKILSLIILFECINLFQINYLRSEQKFKIYSFVILQKAILHIFFVSFFVLKGYGIIGAVFGLLIVDICILITFIFIIMKKIRYKLPHFYNLKEYMKFGIPTVPGNLSGWIVHSSDKYIIGLLLGTIYVGYYSPAYAVGSIITLYIAPLAVTLPPILSYNYDNKKIYLVNNILEYSYKYYMILAIPSVVGLSLLSKNILILLSTPDIAKESYLVVPFVATGMLIIGSNTIVSQPIFLGKNTRIIGSAWIIAALINIILNIIIIPIVGIIGAAITTLVAFLLIHLIIIYYSRKIIIFNMNIKNIILSIMSSLFFILPFHIINTTNILNIIFCVFICIIIYSILLLLFKVIKIEEINYINRYIIKSYK